MFHCLIIFALTLFCLKSSFAKIDTLTFKQVLKNENIQKSILKEPYVSTTMSNIIYEGKKGQSMIFWAAGLHEKSCRVALRKLSRYEEYKNYLSFLEESSYFEESNRVSFIIKTSLFPIRLGLRFKIPRIDKEGVFPFVFEEGFLKNLRGEIHISEDNARCFFYIKSNWQGPDSGFSNTLLELFSNTIIKMGAEKLFRISNY